MGACAYSPGAVLAVSGLVFDSPALVGGLILAGGGGGMTVTLHDGADATAPVIMSFTVGADETDEQINDVPIQSHRSVFADIESGGGTYLVLLA